jgi:hypothetical protein
MKTKISLFSKKRLAVSKCFPMFAMSNNLSHSDTGRASVHARTKFRAFLMSIYEKKAVAFPKFISCSPELSVGCLTTRETAAVFFLPVKSNNLSK